MDWFLKNKEWLLSGIAVTIPLAIISWIFGRQKKSKKQPTQIQIGGDNSKNIQAGGNLLIKNEDKNV